MPLLLTACNEALLQVGEREQSDLSTPVGKKARLAIRGAIDMCATMHAWRFLRQTVITTNWLNGVVTLPPFKELYQVTSGNILLTPTNPAALLNRLAQSPVIGIPSRYCVTGDNQVTVYPEPSLADKNAMQFRLLLEPTLPSLATDDIVVPTPFYELVVLYAQIILHRTHTTDLASAEAAQRDFEIRMHLSRTRDNLQTVSNLGG